MHAELWGVLHGLELAAKLGRDRIIIEADSMVAVNMILNGCPSTHPCQLLIIEINVLMQCFTQARC